MLKQLLFAGLCGTIMMASCGENTGDKMENEADTMGAKVENGMDDMGNKADTMMNSMAGNPDEDFLEDAVELNTKELRALMMGQKMGGAETKKHSTHMIADHKKLGADVKAYLAKKNLTLDGVDTADTKMDLADDKTGADWDKDFADLMVSDHEKTISRFEDAQDDVKDPELKAMIEKTLPTLRSHLTMAKEMQTAADAKK